MNYDEISAMYRRLSEPLSFIKDAQWMADQAAAVDRASGIGAMARQMQGIQDSLAGGAVGVAAGLAALQKQGQTVSQLYNAINKEVNFAQSAGLAAIKDMAAIMDSAQRWQERLAVDAASAVGIELDGWSAAKAGLGAAGQWQALAEDVMSSGLGSAFAKLDVGYVGAASAALRSIADGTIDVHSSFSKVIGAEFTLDAVVAEAGPVAASVEVASTEAGWSGTAPLVVTFKFDNPLNLIGFLIALFALWLQFSQNAEAEQRHAELLHVIHQLAAACGELPQRAAEEDPLTVEPTRH